MGEDRFSSIECVLFQVVDVKGM